MKLFGPLAPDNNEDTLPQQSETEKVALRDGVYKVLISMGYKLIHENALFNYHKEFPGRADCYIRLDSDSLYLKVYSKKFAFADSDTIGPPLPNADDLRAFLRFNTWG